MIEKKPIRLIELLCIIFLFCCFVLELRCWIYPDIPKELREGTLIAIASQFASGVNPYIVPSNGGMPVFYMYGFMAPLVAGAVSAVTGLSVLITSTICYAVYKISACILMGALIYKKHKRWELALLSASMLYACFWRYTVYGGVFPDALGLFLAMLLYYVFVVGIEKGKQHPVLLAFIVTIMFYTKIYFAFTFLGIAVYFLVYEKREFLKFMIAGAILCISSIVVVNLVFPLYFTEAVLYMSGSPDYSILYSLKQLVALGKLFPLPIVAVAVYVLYRGAGFIKKKISMEHFFGFPLIFFFCMLFVAVYFGRNDGTWLTYFLQLLVPALIMLFCEAYVFGTDNFTGSKSNHPLLKGIGTDGWKGGVFYAILAILLLVPMVPYSLNRSLDDSQLSEWENLYNEMDSIREYRPSDDVLILGTPFAFYCIRNGLNTIDAGECQYINGKVMDKWNNDKQLQLLFPYAKDIYDCFQNETHSVRNKILNEEAEYIIIDDDIYDYDMDGDILASYDLCGVYPIMVGSFAREVKIYRVH